MKISLFTSTILVGLMLAMDLSAQTLSIQPGLVRMENENLTIGVDFEAGYEREYTLTSESGFPRFIEFDAKASGSLLPKPKYNPNHQKADLFFGYLISFKKAQDLQLGEIPEPSPDFGSLSVGLNVNYETDQTFDEQNLEIGAELRYVNTSQQALPVLEASYLFVNPVQSQLRDGVNEAADIFKRLDLRSFWAIRLNRFLLNPDFRYFKSQDLAPALEEAGLDDGFHSSVTLGYMVTERESGFLSYFDYFYIQYNYGQFPVYSGDRETFEAGLTFSF